MSKASDRSYQHRIDLVKQEITAVKKTLANQRRVIANIRSSLTATDSSEVNIQIREEIAARRTRENHPVSYQYPAPIARYYGAALPGRGPYVPQERIAYDAVTRADDYMGLDDEFVNEIATASKLSPTDAGGLRGLFFLECSRLIEQREWEFRRYLEYANDLEAARSYKMDTTKDRQENAIFAFTLVTIIFLPMSAVSSIFGMNTKDIRDMEANQWLYWSVSLPLTFAVIIAGLWGMNELGNVARWFMRKPKQSSGGYGGMVNVQGLEQMYQGPPHLQQHTYGPPPPPPSDPADYGPPVYTPAPGYGGVPGRYRGRIQARHGRPVSMYA